MHYYFLAKDQDMLVIILTDTLQDMRHIDEMFLVSPSVARSLFLLLANPIIFDNSFLLHGIS